MSFQATAAEVSMALQKPPKYFDLYTKQPNEDARAGISSSSSRLQLVPKASRHSSRHPRRNRTNNNNKASSDIGTFEERHGHHFASRSHPAPIPLTEDALVQHVSMLPAQDSPLRPEVEEPVCEAHASAYLQATESSFSAKTIRSSSSVHRSKLALPARRAVPSSHDIVAGPSNPVLAESITNLAVSDAKLSPLPPSPPESESFPTVLLDRLVHQHALGRGTSDPVFIKSQDQGRVGKSESTDRCSIKNDIETAAAHSPERKPISSSESMKHQQNRLDGPMRCSLSASSPPVPTIPARFRCEGQRILSIDEIVSMQQTAHLFSRQVGHSAGLVLTSTVGPRSRTTTEASDDSQGSSDVDSVTDEIMQSMQRQRAGRSAITLRHATSQPSLSSSESTHYRFRQTSVFSEAPPESPCLASTLQTVETHLVHGTPSTNEEIARYIRSPRLTRLLTLRSPPNHHLVVSLADVGIENGHPVVVFLGLGSVRYLVALYDDLAASLGLRLICIDRWGLGKTGEVPDSKRGSRAWSLVVEEVLDQLAISKFSIIAHSAGTPYALASSIHLASRVHGTIQLLAPWVGSAGDSTTNAYKWLKFIPSSVIKTAQAAEWKMQGWRLGKIPKKPEQGVGFDPRAPLSSESTATNPIFADLAANYLERDDSESTPQPKRTASPAMLSSEKVDSFDTPVSARFLSTPTQCRSRKTSVDTARDCRSEAGQTRASSRLVRKSSTSSRTASNTTASNDSVTSMHKNPDKLDLGTALLRASHAESLKGGTSDLLAILQKTGRMPELSYADVIHPVRAWHGLKDDKISLQSVLTLETLMPNCKVDVIPGADHSLMTNVAVFVQVLQAIASEWNVSSRL